MQSIKNTLSVLATGYIFVYFSEHLFWARARPDDSLAGWFGAWIAYSLIAFVFLSAMAHFRVRNLWALFLAGTLVGWLAEGVIVQTTYEMLPLSISFTGLAWHALLTVWVGWHALLHALRERSGLAALGLAAAIGLAAGLWAISWWNEPGEGIAPLASYASFMVATTVLLIVACWLALWSASAPFRPGRWPMRIIFGLFAAYFCLVAVPAAPPALVILPVLLGLCYLGLRRHQRHQGGLPLLAGPGPAIPLLRFAALLAIPATSVAVYALALWLQLRWPTNWLLYAITTPLGFVLFGVSLYRTSRAGPDLPGARAKETPEAALPTPTFPSEMS